MTGDKAITEHRRAGRGLRDNAVYVHTDGLKVNRDWQRYGEHAEVQIAADDYPELLDLRFAMGLRVHVEGSDQQRIDQVAAAFVAAHAARVLTTIFQQIGGRAEVVRLTDTDGVMVWQG